MIKEKDKDYELLNLFACLDWFSYICSRYHLKECHYKYDANVLIIPMYVLPYCRRARGLIMCE